MYPTRPGVGFGRRTKNVPTKVFASQRDHHGHHYDGKLVDEDMIVLRKRIHETKMMEEKHEPPSHWMEWEKRYYEDYDDDVCEAVGLLQSQLMKTRPSLALAMAVLVSVSVPVSMGVIVFRFMELASEALFAIPFH
ncbi:hypothetical protein FNV43_RR26416 [Rhamnella rubrinervis]|uniref:Uncharacterized protein n=1 Tax=Rhamnella rubrinervis TaxID=2594499 RepID=A0A8K0DP19_9ROSA|nr:hypothetical protein FNV43_RR26416 [Rhamnella rubrinervis]